MYRYFIELGFYSPAISCWLNFVLITKPQTGKDNFMFSRTARNFLSFICGEFYEKTSIFLAAWGNVTRQSAKKSVTDGNELYLS